MGHVAVWEVLEQMIVDFRKRGMTIPAHIMNDLKSAKTTIRILNAEPPGRGSHQKIDQYLMNVESYLVSEGQKKLGTKYVDEWLDRLDKAGKETGDQVEKETRFIAGAPRQQKWIRIAPTLETPIEKLKTIVEQLKLLCKDQKDGSLLVYGEDQSIKDFVKKVASEHKSKAEKHREKVHNG